MKRASALLLAVIILLSTLSGCGQAPTPTPTELTIGATEPMETTPAVTEPEYKNVYTGELIISEVMPDNRNLILGHEFDWIELYNPGDVAANLDGIYLTDDPANPRALSLAGLQIAPGSYLVVILDDDAAFQLSEVGETAYLTRNNEIIAQLSFAAPDSGESFDENGICKYPTPGFANSETGYLEYLDSVELPGLIITEAITSNSSHMAVDGVYYDLVEVKNNSGKAINLNEYYLTDQWENTQRFYFPDVILQPGEHYVIYCSGNTDLGNNHAPFKLSSSGQSLYLARQGKFMDVLIVPADLKQNESFGRSGNVPVYLNDVTFGEENTDGFLTGVASPAASIVSGVYADAVTVELSGAGTIYYTLDGRRPTLNNALVYKEPIVVSDVTTIRAFCISDGRSSSISNHTYVIGQEHDLPILVISIPASQRNSITNNIELNLEYEAVMTLFENGEMKFSVPMGIRLHGNDSRKGLKKNFQIRFRSEYGAAKLNYRLFEDRNIDEFNSLLLKGGSEDYKGSMIRDELSTYIVNGTTALYTQAMKPVVVYFGGDYWGVHFLRERYSDAYVASHLGGSPESANILFSTSAYVQVGSNADYLALKKYCKNRDMSTTENYVYLTERIDVTGLIDWYVCRTYFADRDLANCRRLKSDEGDGLWHWAFFDLDWSFYHNATPITALLEDVNGDHILIHAVLESDAGRDAFLKRYAYMLRNVLNEDYINQCIDTIVSAIESEMPRDRARWRQSMENWEYEIEQLRKFAQDEKRHQIILKDLKSYLSLTNAEMEYYFGDLYTE